MNEVEKSDILEKAKGWFIETVAPNHKKNIEKLYKLKEFNVNPFLVSYLAGVIGGELTPETMAKALLYPRVLGTSITTSFGTNVQSFMTTVFDAYGSTTTGIDLEFTDAIDGRRKYCQLKLGPQTINKDDVITINGHFNAIRGLARVNNLDIRGSDLVVGIVYGSEDKVSANYKKLRDQYHYPLYVGQEFWHRFTGDAGFYGDFQRSISQAALEVGMHEELKRAVQALASDPALISMIE